MVMQIKTHIVPKNSALFGGVKKTEKAQNFLQKLKKIHIFLTEPTKLLCNAKSHRQCRVSLKSIKEIHHAKMWCKRCLEKYRRMQC